MDAGIVARATELFNTRDFERASASQHAMYWHEPARERGMLRLISLISSACEAANERVPEWRRLFFELAMGLAGGAAEHDATRAGAPQQGREAEQKTALHWI